MGKDGSVALLTVGNDTPGFEPIALQVGGRVGSLDLLSAIVYTGPLAG